MLKHTVTLTNPSGLHARPAAVLVATAKAYVAQITLQYGDKTANAKSILSVLSLGAAQGSQIDIVIDGSDEVAAADALGTIFGNNLGED
ncbi:MAG: HPr family phosphocarrier protein [Sulfobacillus benefaciens]|uniref:Phosphocarrier protein HPr n=1 Tax=Sulfobacillus benefaciens TaxID=453960 RepID=A0A2T2XDI2_9FIRM|nr:MAG: HPr family phosphocarrier protein [Sulfobacillus benefaciens]